MKNYWRGKPLEQAGTSQVGAPPGAERSASSKQSPHVEVRLGAAESTLRTLPRSLGEKSPEPAAAGTDANTISC